MDLRPKIVVIGSLNMDLVIKAVRAPKRGETVLGEEIHFVPGGKGANQAVGLARLGAETTMIGAVGSDDFGVELKKALQKDGVNTSSIKVLDSEATGVASILLAEGDNSIVVVPGANAQCLPEDLDRYEGRIAEADLVLLQLEIPLMTVEYAIKLVRKHGKIVMLNPAPAQSLSQDLLSKVDYLTPNRSELALLTRMSEESTIAQGIERLLEGGVSCCVTTLGAEGVALMEKGGSLVIVSGHKVPVVDTTGAGDAFNAGLAYALAVASQPADFDRAKGLKVMENILQGNKDIQAVFAHNDEMALGALSAIQAAGKSNIMVVGFDATDDAVKAVKDGKLAATVAQKPGLIGKTSLEIALKVAKGEKVDASIPVALELVTK